MKHEFSCTIVPFFLCIINMLHLETKETCTDLIFKSIVQISSGWISTEIQPNLCRLDLKIKVHPVHPYTLYVIHIQWRYLLIGSPSTWNATFLQDNQIMFHLYFCWRTQINLQRLGQTILYHDPVVESSIMI